MAKLESHLRLANTMRAVEPHQHTPMVRSTPNLVNGRSAAIHAATKADRARYKAAATLALPD